MSPRPKKGTAPIMTATEALDAQRRTVDAHIAAGNAFVSATAASAHDLLAELEGDVTIPAPVNFRNTTPDPVAALDVPAPAPATAVKRADAVHSTAAGGKGYRVTVTGDYYAPSRDVPGKKILKPYTVTVNLPSLERAMSVIKGKVLGPVLKAKFGEEYHGFRTHNIVEAVPLSSETPESNNLQFMNRARLEEYARANSVPLSAPVSDPVYADTTDLRASLIDWTLNPGDFAERETRRVAERREVAELRAMNPEMAG